MNALDKIQALKRLSENKSATPAEAANAAARVQELMLKHKITEADLGVEDSAEEVTWFKDDPLHVSKRESTWRLMLAIGIANVNGCKCMTGFVPGGVRRTTLVGRASDVEVVKYIYAYLEREIDALAKSHLASYSKPPYLLAHTSLMRGKSFRLGAVNVIISRLKEQKEQVEQEARTQGQSSALAVIDNREAGVQAWVDRHAKEKRVITNDSVDTASWHAGKAAANSIALHRALGVNSKGESGGEAAR
jgi:hypothetical protein